MLFIRKIELKAKIQKEIPQNTKYNKILNFSIEKEIQSIVGHLDNIEWKKGNKPI